MKEQTPLDHRLSHRSAVFVMRFDPRVKYMADLAARRERRSLTSFVEWAIDRALAEVRLRGTGKASEMTVAQGSDLLWDIDEVERLKKLEAHCPDLLNYDEQRILAIISEFGTGDEKSIRFKEDGKIDWPRVKSCWQEIKAYTSGKAQEQDLIAAVRAASK